jgi:hypothetical protein
VRRTSGCDRTTRSVHMQAWRIPMLELTPGAISDSLSGTADASDAMTSAVTAGAAAASSLPPEILAAGGIAARMSRLSWVLQMHSAAELLVFKVRIENHRRNVARCISTIAPH